MIEESVKQVCMTMQEVPECLTIADLGCSSGPNALEAIWEIINISTHFYQNKRVKLPEYNIFLNDLMGNDFNTLFKLLPEFYKKLKKANFGNNCFVSVTPGSFHGRLFPTNSLHLVHSSSSLHFLSQVSIFYHYELDFFDAVSKFNVRVERLLDQINCIHPYFNFHAKYVEGTKFDFYLNFLLKS